jgi:NitT/TauT family transport system substrate-binding protein
MLAGEVDLATVAETPMWRQAQRGRPLVLWATLAETRRSEWIIARGDRGITGPADVVGRRIAVPRGTTAEIYLLAFLDLYGIDRARVTIEDVQPQDMAARLAAGEVDVGCVWEPFASKIQSTLDHPVLMHDDFIYRMTWNLVGRSDRPVAAVERVLRAIDRADHRMLADDPRVVDGVARWCALEPELVRRTIPDHHYTLQLEGSLLTEIEEQVKLIDGPAAAPPDILGLIDARPLANVLPEAVSVPAPDAR